jgi:hypothetical protein
MEIELTNNLSINLSKHNCHLVHQKTKDEQDMYPSNLDMTLCTCNIHGRKCYECVLYKDGNVMNVYYAKVGNVVNAYYTKVGNVMNVYYAKVGNVMNVYYTKIVHSTHQLHN